MRPFLVRPASRIKGKIVLPGDKSIAHRSIILSAIAKGNTLISNFPFNNDCLATIRALQDLGIQIKLDKHKSCLTVFGKGLGGLKRPRKNIFVGDSGTTFRLLLGLLAGQNFAVTIKAGKSLSQRPMRRVSQPLRIMGAKINARGKAAHEEYPPASIAGTKLRAITYKMPLASAQVKSAILLAGLYADGSTQVIEPIITRDHTERILKLFQADIKIKGNIITVNGNRSLISPEKIYLPADISSAAFFMVLAAILPDSKIIIKDVSLNPSRLGAVRVLKRMGAKIKLSAVRSTLCAGYEPLGDIIVESSILKATKVKKEEIPSLIDELPILMIAACFAKGKTVLEGVRELRVKETDRIKSMCGNLRKMGAKLEIITRLGSERLIIQGVGALRGAKVCSFGDHRTAMSMVVAGLKAKGDTIIDDVSCISKSFPEFLTFLKPLIQ